MSALCVRTERRVRATHPVRVALRFVLYSARVALSVYADLTPVPLPVTLSVCGLLSPAASSHVLVRGDSFCDGALGAR